MWRKVYYYSNDQTIWYAAPHRNIECFVFIPKPDAFVKSHIELVSDLDLTLKYTDDVRTDCRTYMVMESHTEEGISLDKKFNLVQVIDECVWENSYSYQLDVIMWQAEICD